jgi:hypothetical protein
MLAGRFGSLPKHHKAGLVGPALLCVELVRFVKVLTDRPECQNSECQNLGAARRLETSEFFVSTKSQDLPRLNLPCATLRHGSPADKG